MEVTSGSVEAVPLPFVVEAADAVEVVEEVKAGEHTGGAVPSCFVGVPRAVAAVAGWAGPEADITPVAVAAQ